MSALAVRSLAIAVALAAGLALFAETRHYGLIGWDTHPLIASSRVETAGDFVGLFVERLMDGRYPSVFHRPLTSASFALDEALWGLEPFGYQLTGGLLFTSLLLLLVALGTRLGGERARWMAVALPLAFALHSSYYEIVPIPARRADLLCAVFAVAAVVLALGERALAAGVASLCAILSKESGYAVPVLIAAAAGSFAQGRDLASRARAALVAASPAASLAVFALAARFGLLGGLGGHRDDFSVTGALAMAPGVALELIRGIALFGSSSTPAAWAALSAGIVLAISGLVLARAGSEERGDERRALAFGGFWVGAFALTYASAGWVGAWYFMIPAVGASIMFAALVGWLVRLAFERESAAVVRAICAAAALLILGVGLWQASFAPFFRSYGEWQRATETADEFLRELDRRIGESPSGSLVEAPPIPMWAFPREGIPGVAGAAILSDYSVQAWAELVYPDRRIRVLGVSDGVLAPGPVEAAPDEIVVRIARRRVGY